MPRLQLDTSTGFSRKPNEQESGIHPCVMNCPMFVCFVSLWPPKLEMIQFDLRIFFRWVAQPPTSTSIYTCLVPLWWTIINDGLKRWSFSLVNFSTKVFRRSFEPLGFFSHWPLARYTCANWWQLKYFCECSPLITWGNDPIWRSHIFQMGWFNHQPAFVDTLPKFNIAPEKWCLEDDPFLLGWSISVANC